MSNTGTMVQREHELKITQNALDEILSGAKAGDVRDCTDREFIVGDKVLLREIDSSGAYTGRAAHQKITNVQSYFGLPENLRVLSYSRAEECPEEHAPRPQNSLSDLASNHDETLAQLGEREHRIELFANCLSDILVASGLITPGSRPSDLQLIQLGIEYRDKLNSE